MGVFRFFAALLLVRLSFFSLAGESLTSVFDPNSPNIPPLFKITNVCADELVPFHRICHGQGR